MRHYDLCVIGSGPAGQKAAIQAAKLGRAVCVVEQRETVGGVAVNTGTIPSKALREAILQLLGRPSAMPRGSDFAAARDLTLAGLRASCERVIGAEVNLVRRHFESNGIDIVTGRAVFRAPNLIDVVRKHGHEDIHADHVVIAVGTSPARPPNVPFNGVNVISSDDVVKLERLPHSMIIVGGGVIGTEYASMMAALGVKVTLVEGRERLLEFVDREIIEALQYHLRQSGTTLRLGEKVTGIRTVEAGPNAKATDNVLVEATLESGKTLRADSLMYCIGRQGATAGLNLAAAGIDADERGRIKVDAHFRTSCESVYACGDVIGFPALASTSMEQGRLAACHIFGARCDTVPELLPYGIYAIPEISMVGWTEERLTQAGVPYECGIAQYREIARGQLLGDELGMLKLLMHQDTHAVLGVHAIGTGATELIHIGQAAIAFNATAEYFVNTVFNYPTLAECYKVAALNGLNKLRNV